MTWFRQRFRNRFTIFWWYFQRSLRYWVFSSLKCLSVICAAAVTVPGAHSLIDIETCSHIQLLTSLPAPPGQFFRQQMCSCLPLDWALIRHALLSASTPAAAQGVAGREENTADPSPSDSSLATALSPLVAMGWSNRKCFQKTFKQIFPLSLHFQTWQVLPPSYLGNYCTEPMIKPHTGTCCHQELHLVPFIFSFLHGGPHAPTP